MCRNINFSEKYSPLTSTGARDGRGGAFSSGAGRRQKSAGRGKRAKIIMEIFVVYYDVLINEDIISSHY